LQRAGVFTTLAPPQGLQTGLHRVQRAGVVQQRQRAGEVEAGLPDHRHGAVRAGGEQGDAPGEQVSAARQVALGAQQFAFDLRDAAVQPGIGGEVQFGVAAQPPDGLGSERRVGQQRGGARHREPGFGAHRARLRPVGVDPGQHGAGFVDMLFSERTCINIIPLGFTYNGFGPSTSTMSVSSNGVLLLGQPCSTVHDNATLPT